MQVSPHALPTVQILQHPPYCAWDPHPVPPIARPSRRTEARRGRVHRISPHPPPCAVYRASTTRVLRTCICPPLVGRGRGSEGCSERAPPCPEGEDDRPSLSTGIAAPSADSSVGLMCRWPDGPLAAWLPLGNSIVFECTFAFYQSRKSPSIRISLFQSRSIP